MSNRLPAWTAAEQDQHRRELADALDDIAWDPDWPDLAATLIPDAPAPRLRVGFGWSSLAYQPANK